MQLYRENSAVKDRKQVRKLRQAAEDYLKCAMAVKEQSVRGLLMPPQCFIPHAFDPAPVLQIRWFKYR